VIGIALSLVIWICCSPLYLQILCIAYVLSYDWKLQNQPGTK
jgi:hypothetical protein